MFGNVGPKCIGTQYITSFSKQNILLWSFLYKHFEISFYCETLSITTQLKLFSGNWEDYEQSEI